MGTAITRSVPQHPGSAGGNEEVEELIQEAKNEQKIPLQEKFHWGILKNVINISDTL